MDEERLIAELKAGNRKAFGSLLDLHQSLIFNACLNYVYNVQDAEDLCQEVFLEVFRSIDKFKGESKLSTWIYRIAVTKSLEHLRKHKRKKRSGTLLSLWGLQESGFDIPSSEIDHPGIQMENKEKGAILFAAIASLPDSQRIAFTMNKVEGRSYQEVAEIMEMSLSAAESLIFRARKNLQKQLEDFYKNDQ